MNHIFYAGGGIGDFLQFKKFISENNNYLYFVHTHCQSAKDFFDFLNLENILFLFYKNNEQRINQLQYLKFSLVEVPRVYFDDYIQTDKNKNLICSLFNEKKPIIGIHPFGSSFSNELYSRYKVPIKHINKETITKIIYDNVNFNYLIYGSKKEIEQYSLKESKNIKFICFDNIYESLMSVKSCSKFIGTDSCFKNMACINKIKTLCVYGDYQDETRDKNFITPYENAKIMTSIKIKQNNEIETQINKITEFLKNE